MQIREGYQSYDSGLSNECDLPQNYWQRKLWILLEYPESSIMARVVGMFSLLVIIISIVTFCMDTMPEYHYVRYEHEHTPSPAPNSPSSSSPNATQPDADTIHKVSINWNRQMGALGEYQFFFCFIQQIFFLDSQLIDLFRRLIEILCEFKNL